MTEAQPLAIKDEAPAIDLTLTTSAAADRRQRRAEQDALRDLGFLV
jgi:hypothetical protein